MQAFFVYLFILLFYFSSATTVETTQTSEVNQRYQHHAIEADITKYALDVTRLVLRMTKELVKENNLSWRFTNPKRVFNKVMKLEQQLKKSLTRFIKHYHHHHQLVSPEEPSQSKRFLMRSNLNDQSSTRADRQVAKRLARFFMRISNAVGSRLLTTNADEDQENGEFSETPDKFYPGVRNADLRTARRLGQFLQRINSAQPLEIKNRNLWDQKKSKRGEEKRRYVDRWMSVLKQAFPSEFDTSEEQVGRENQNRRNSKAIAPDKSGVVNERVVLTHLSNFMKNKSLGLRREQENVQTLGH